MSVSTELLCSFELLKPLDSNALKNHIKKGRNKRAQMLNSPVCFLHDTVSGFVPIEPWLTTPVACRIVSPERVKRWQ